MGPTEKLILLTNPLEMEHEQTLFQVLRDGPLKVSGRFRIKGSDGKLIKTEGPVYLCRCGQSSNKPFCSGRHKQIGFSD